MPFGDPSEIPSQFIREFLHLVFTEKPLRCSSWSSYPNFCIISYPSIFFWFFFPKFIKEFLLKISSEVLSVVPLEFLLKEPSEILSSRVPLGIPTNDLPGIFQVVVPGVSYTVFLIVPSINIVSEISFTEASRILCSGVPAGILSRISLDGLLKFIRDCLLEIFFPGILFGVHSKTFPKLLWKFLLKFLKKI